MKKYVKQWKSENYLIDKIIIMWDSSCIPVVVFETAVPWLSISTSTDALGLEVELVDSERMTSLFSVQ